MRFSPDSPGSPVSRAKKLKLEKQIKDPLFYQYKEEVEDTETAMEVDTPAKPKKIKVTKTKTEVKAEHMVESVNRDFEESGNTPLPDSPANSDFKDVSISGHFDRTLVIDQAGDDHDWLRIC